MNDKQIYRTIRTGNTTERLLALMLVEQRERDRQTAAALAGQWAGDRRLADAMDRLADRLAVLAERQAERPAAGEPAPGPRRRGLLARLFKRSN